MGVHWYARSRELAEILREQEEVERRIMAVDADADMIDSALDAREVLFTKEDAARAELARRGATVTIAAVRGWPATVRGHIAALGATPTDRPVLEVLGWGTDYYIENLRDAGVPMRAFGQPLERLRASPGDAQELGVALLQHASRARKVHETRHSREAGLWLYLWGSLGCCVLAGD